jgi:hypothetical protein
MGFDNIMGLPSLDEAWFAGRAGAWYGSLTCTGREQPADDESHTLRQGREATPTDRLVKAYPFDLLRPVSPGGGIVRSWPSSPLASG